MNNNFDTRPWNLFTGVALLTAGCGTRVAGTDAGETGETADTVETAEGPECMTADECPAGYGCYDGVCMYYPHHDGWTPNYECYSNEECPEFELCEFGYCELVDSPPQDCTQGGFVFGPLQLQADGVLALTFADADADGWDELVAATQTELWVHEADGTDPIISSREPGEAEDMVAGNFDAEPGEDVMLLVDESLVLHGSNGDGSFAAPTVTLAPVGFVARLLAAELDDQPPTDLLGWGGLGAFVSHNGEVLMLSTAQYGPGAVHDFNSPGPGIALRRGSSIDLFDLTGATLGSIELMAGPSVLAGFTVGSDGEYVSLVSFVGWSLVQAHRANLTSREWVIDGEPQQVFAADFDGDGYDELVFSYGTSVVIEVHPGRVGDCKFEIPVPANGLPVDAAVGDWNGDGSEELAMLTDLGEIVVLDGG